MSTKVNPDPYSMAIGMVAKVIPLRGRKMVIRSSQQTTKNLRLAISEKMPKNATTTIIEANSSAVKFKTNNEKLIEPAVLKADKNCEKPNR